MSRPLKAPVQPSQARTGLPRHGRPDVRSPHHPQVAQDPLRGNPPRLRLDVGRERGLRRRKRASCAAAGWRISFASGAIWTRFGAAGERGGRAGPRHPGAGGRPVSRVAWDRTHRVVSARFPPIHFFDDIADPRDWELLAAAEAGRTRGSTRRSASSASSSAVAEEADVSARPVRGLAYRRAPREPPSMTAPRTA